MSILKYLTEHLIDENQQLAKQIAQSGKSSFTLDTLKTLKSTLGLERYKYLGWLAKNWESLNPEKINSMLDTYESLINRQSSNIHYDINQYKTADEFLDAIQSDTSNPTFQSVNDTIGKNELIYNKNSIKVYRVLDTTCSIELGKNTSWCTARDDNKNMFSTYIQYGSKFVIINGNLSLSDPEHKIGVVRNDGDNGYTFKEFQNVKNHKISTSEYLDKWSIPANIFTYIPSDYVRVKNAIYTNDLKTIKKYISTITVDASLLDLALDNNKSEDIVLMLANAIAKQNDGHFDASSLNLFFKYYKETKSANVLHRIFNEKSTPDDKTLDMVVEFAPELFNDIIKYNPVLSPRTLQLAVRGGNAKIINSVHSMLKEYDELHLYNNSVNNVYKVLILLNKIDMVKNAISYDIYPNIDSINLALLRANPNYDLIYYLIDNADPKYPSKDKIISLLDATPEQKQLLSSHYNKEDN